MAGSHALRVDFEDRPVPCDYRFRLCGYIQHLTPSCKSGLLFLPASSLFSQRRIQGRQKTDRIQNMRFVVVGLQNGLIIILKPLPPT